MSFFSRTLKPILVRCLVSPDNTAIRSGVLRGRLLPRSIAAGNLAMVFGTYERQIQALLTEQSRGCVIAYDVGAHVGFLSLLFAELVPQCGHVYAFEPSSREAGMIDELIRCNALHDRLSVHRFAVCDEVGEICFHASDASFTGILNKAAENQQRNASSGVIVQAITLDAFVYDMGYPAPDIIKLDVESAEPLVLAGARRLLANKRPRLVIEVHGPDACRDTVVELLKQGYRIELLFKTDRIPVTVADQLRPLFQKNKWTHHLLALPS